MNFLAVLFIISAFCTGAPAHADDNTGTDCWSPIAAVPVDLSKFGARVMLADFKMAPAGSFKPMVLPVWVSMVPRLGEHTEAQALEVRKIGNLDEDVDGSGDIDPNGIPPLYVLELGKKNGEAAPIVASGSKTGDLSGEGNLSIRNVVDIFGKATTGANSIATRTGADIQFIRVPIGKTGVTFVGVTRGALEIQSTGSSVSGSFAPGAGFSFEIPTGDTGQNLRIGLIGGPSFSLGSNPGSNAGFVSPAISSGAQLLFF